MPTLLQLAQSYQNPESVNYRLAYLREQMEQQLLSLGDLPMLTRSSWPCWGRQSLWVDICGMYDDILSLDLSKILLEV